MADWRTLALPVAAMVAVVAGSNLAVQYPINDWLTWGAFTYPVAFLVTDLTNRKLGPQQARRGPDGRVLLYLISDDNFTVLQRTLLLQLSLPDRAGAGSAGGGERVGGSHQRPEG